MRCFKDQAYLTVLIRLCFVPLNSFYISKSKMARHFFFAISRIFCYYTELVKTAELEKMKQRIPFSAPSFCCSRDRQVRDRKKAT